MTNHINPRLTQAITDLANRGALFAVGHSAGKDSQAQFLAITKLVPAEQIIVVHADLGEVEWTGNLDHIRATIGDAPLHIARAVFKDGSPKDLFSAIRARRAYLDSKGKTEAPAFPSSAARFCTSDLKTGPVWKVIKQVAKAQGRSIIVNCCGIRAEESKSRAKKVAEHGGFKVNAKNSNSKWEAYDLWPICDWTIDQVWSEIAEAGQEPHPQYANGNERLSCVFCIFGSKNDLRNGALARPDLYRKYVELEQEVRGTMFNGESLQERTGITIIAKAS